MEKNVVQNSLVENLEIIVVEIAMVQKPIGGKKLVQMHWWKNIWCKSMGAIVITLVCLFVCVQNNSKRYDRIWMKFSGFVDIIITKVKEEQVGICE